MENPVKILILNNEFEAELMEEILNDREIPFMIRSFHDSAYDGIWQTNAGWGSIMAPPEYREEIEKLYSEMINSKIDADPEADQQG
jgi:hypothetical protein